MKFIIRVSLLVAFVLFFSCEDQGLIVKCPDCTADEPVSTDLQIKLDAEQSGFPTTIKVYEGNLDDSILYSTSSSTTTFKTISVTLNKKYTVTATYIIPIGKYYTAVDAATPRVRYEKDQCDDPCYFVYDRDIDLRLKYTK